MSALKLGLLLSTPPTHPSVETVVQLAQAALRKGVDVYLYLIDEGVEDGCGSTLSWFDRCRGEDVCVCLRLSTTWCVDDHDRFEGFFVRSRCAVGNC
mgnify:CR=1 FL=1